MFRDKEDKSACFFLEPVLGHMTGWIGDLTMEMNRGSSALRSALDERKRHIKLRHPRDTGRVTLGHPAGQTGVYRPLSHNAKKKKVLFCRDTGRSSQGHLTVQAVFRNFMWFFLMCLFFPGKKRHININKFAGLSRVWVGGRNLFVCVCVFRVFPYGGENTHKQNPPQNPGTSPWKFCLRVFFLFVFFLRSQFVLPSNFWRLGPLVLRRFLRRGSKKGLSRRQLEAETCFFWRVRSPLRVPSFTFQKSETKNSVIVRSEKTAWRVPNPPGANPLVAERAFPTSDYWGRTGVARCAEEMTGISRDFQ